MFVALLLKNKIVLLEILWFIKQICAYVDRRLSKGFLYVLQQQTTVSSFISSVSPLYLLVSVSYINTLYSKLASEWWLRKTDRNFN